MGVRERVLSALTEEQGARVPGAQLARRLDVSRNAVWKAVAALRQEGYEIESTPDGYALDARSDLISAEALDHVLTPGFFHTTVVRSVDSTNRLAKQLASEGAPEGTLVVADAQVAGRGRLGRAFYSPPGTGAYMSVVLRPRLPAREAMRLTTLAAVAVCEAIECVAGREARIKWVNDVLVDGKKVCGILTEASLDMESGGVEYAVVGIGLNVREPEGGMPEALRGIAGAIVDGPVSGSLRCRLVGEVMNRLRHYYVGLEDKRWLDAYRARSAVVGRWIDVLLPGGTRRALAIGIDDECALIVRYEDGTEEALAFGEVSTRI